MKFLISILFLHLLHVLDDFNWLWRIKVALGIARLLDFLHGQNKPYLIFNIDACHIMVDQVGLNVFFSSLLFLKFSLCFAFFLGISYIICHIFLPFFFSGIQPHTI